MAQASDEWTDRMQFVSICTFHPNHWLKHKSGSNCPPSLTKRPCTMVCGYALGRVSPSIKIWDAKAALRAQRQRASGQTSQGASWKAKPTRPSDLIRNYLCLCQPINLQVNSSFIAPLYAGSSDKRNEWALNQKEFLKWLLSVNAEKDRERERETDLREVLKQERKSWSMVIRCNQPRGEGSKAQ